MKKFFVLILLFSTLFSALYAQEAETTASPSPGISYEVAFVPPLLSVNVYSSPHSQNYIGSLSNGSSLTLNGQIQDGWLGIDYEGQAAWIHQDYVIGNLNPVIFCQDTRINPLIEDLQEAVRNHDGQAMANLIAPAGLYLGLQGHTIHLSHSEVWNIFDDHEQRYFGNNANTGNAIIKTLADDIVLLLQEDLIAVNASVACQNNQDGLSDTSVLYAVQLPDSSDYNLRNFYSIMRPAENDLNWGAWGIGISYWQDEPKILALGHYVWTP